MASFTDIDKANARIQELEAAIQLTLSTSIPYVLRYGAFLIPAEAWEGLNNAVTPGAKALANLLRRYTNGEKITEEEIREVLEGKP